MPQSPGFGIRKIGPISGRGICLPNGVALRQRPDPEYSEADDQHQISHEPECPEPIPSVRQEAKRSRKRPHGPAYGDASAQHEAEPKTYLVGGNVRHAETSIPPYRHIPSARQEGEPWRVVDRHDPDERAPPVLQPIGGQGRSEPVSLRDSVSDTEGSP